MWKENRLSWLRVLETEFQDQVAHLSVFSKMNEMRDFRDGHCIFRAWSTSRGPRTKVISRRQVLGKTDKRKEPDQIAIFLFVVMLI